MGSTECQAVGIGEFPTSWDEPLDHGDETFGRHCNAGHDQDGALLHSLLDHEVTRGIDAGHTRFAGHTASKTVSHLND